jgi:hypothetical protein
MAAFSLSPGVGEEESFDCKLFFIRSSLVRRIEGEAKWMVVEGSGISREKSMGEKSRHGSGASGDDADLPPGGIGRVSRRAVLRAGTLGAAAVGAVSAFPGLLGELTAAGPEVLGGASEATALATDTEAVSASALEGPIVAHIRDAATGEISLYVGEREIAYRDTALVHQLMRVTR